MEALLSLARAEWASLSAAPWSFALLVVTAFGAAFAICQWAYRNRHETTMERFELLNERLAAKEEQLDEYRQRLGLAPASGSKFSRLTHKELQEYTLKFIEGIRVWFSQSDAETRRIADQQWYAMTRAQTEEQRHQLWEAHSSTHTNGLFTLMREFDQKYKVDAILLRDELLARLPANEKNVQIERRYESPVNTFGIQAIVDDLEKKAKLLL